MTEPEQDHVDLMLAAIERDGAGQRALFEDRPNVAARAFAEAAALYRRSWELAPPASYGRLVGMLKAAVLGGGGAREAAFARAELAEDRSESPPAAYARALVALIDGNDERAGHWSEAMRNGPEGFVRAAEAIAALAERDRGRYAAALRTIVTDFEARTEHLTGVPIADTALVFERLAARRGIAAGIQSPLLPALPLTG